jgi:hypothetical protein
MGSVFHCLLGLAQVVKKILQILGCCNNFKSALACCVVMSLRSQLVILQMDACRAEDVLALLHNRLDRCVCASFCNSVFLARSSYIPFRVGSVVLCSLLGCFVMCVNNYK